MKTLNYLLILIAIAAIAVSFIVIETDNKLIALSTASACIAALFDRGISYSLLDSGLNVISCEFYACRLCNLMNMVNGLTVILLVLLLDIAVIWSVIHSVRQQKYKLLYILIILLIPILGVAIYYLIKK